MSEKIVIITGATDGIGKVAAREILKKGYSVALVARNKEKLNQVNTELAPFAVKNSISLYQADLSSLKETKKVAEKIKKDFPKIHVLLNNAGAFFSDRAVTGEGLESTFALNHLNYFVFADVLIPCLHASGEGRIVNVASGAHFGVSLDFDNLQGETKYSGWKQYQKSKLMNVYFTYELDERLKEKSITVNCLHPGFVKTKFGHNNIGFTKSFIQFVQNLFAINEDKGAKTSVFLATSDEVKNVTGQYFEKSRAKKSSKQSYDIAARKELWKRSEQIAKTILK
ncbi:SDR family oxidoreductase [Leptospira ilyithenensis]|uniref:SDR family oxidoreductase n=1 Tax=Leptospira ilyithenensis TaxID=2484901 RepID=A0A4R9LM53_9LEPT|nr:SDR family oxidoreductase [Leptospira ilyithenensis]TGN07080.1 SDR family oxidoreductase [Leptospira ilyithenensis]